MSEEAKRDVDPEDEVDEEMRAEGKVRLKEIGTIIKC